MAYGQKTWNGTFTTWEYHSADYHSICCMHFVQTHELYSLKNILVAAQDYSLNVWGRNLTEDPKISLFK